MWVEVARPGQGNLGWLLEEGRGEILLPVEEREAADIRGQTSSYLSSHTFFFVFWQCIHSVCASPCLGTFALDASPVSRALSSRVPSLASSLLQLPAQVTRASERPSLPTCHSLASSLLLRLPPDIQLFFMYHYYCCYGFVVFETGSYSSPGCLGFHYRAPSWPQTHGEPPVSASQVPRWYDGATPP